MHPLEEFINKEVARKDNFFNDIKREEAVDLFNQLTKLLSFSVKVTEDDGDMVGFEITTRFHLSRSEAREATRQERDAVEGVDRERPVKPEKGDKPGKDDKPEKDDKKKERPDRGN